MGTSPESEIQVKFFADIGKNVVKIWRNILQIFVLQFPGKMGVRHFTKKPLTNFTSHETKFFHCETLGAGGSKKRGFQ